MSGSQASDLFLPQLGVCGCFLGFPPYHFPLGSRLCGVPLLRGEGRAEGRAALGQRAGLRGVRGTEGVTFL